MTTAAVPVAERLKALFPHRTHLEHLEAAAERFKKDTSEHVLQVVRDNGVYRHLLAKKPGTSFYWFEVVTWPGSLTINGDMGTFTFSRLEDMFQFFRGERINPQYWAEKLQSNDRGTRFSSDMAAQLLSETISDWAESQDEDGLDSRLSQILGAAKDSIVPALTDEDESEVRTALVNFSTEDFNLYDSWEWDLRDYTIHFLWCCHALVWAIKQYDQVVGSTVESTSSPS